MLTAKDIMTKDVITVLSDTAMTRAVRLLLQNNVNGIPVVDGTNKLVGIICQSDLIAQQKDFPLPSFFTLVDSFIALPSSKKLEQEVNKIAAVSVGQAMTADPVTVTPDTGIDKIATLMVDNNYHTIPVVDGDNLVGIVGKEDVLRTLIPGMISSDS